MTMKKITGFLIIAILVASNSVHAQKCPTVRVTSPDIVKEGQALMFTANITGGDPNVSPTYNWSISAGTISSGQGTSSITVDTKGLGGQSATATVDLGGYDRSCSSYASSTASVDMVPKTELHISGNFTTSASFLEDATKFAGDFMSAYYGSESSKAVVFFYPGKTDAKAAATIKQMTATTKTAFAAMGMTPAMYKITTAGKRGNTSYEMWIVPKDGEAPVATPEH